MEDTGAKLMPFQKPQKHETYRAQMYCGNCHHQFPIQVPKGMLCHVVSWVCPNCGCSKEQIDESIRGQQGPNIYQSR